MKTGFVSALIVVSLLLLGSARQVHAQVAAAPTLDPAVWGVYAKLVDRNWDNQEYHRPKHWILDNGKIIEEYADDDHFKDRAVIERGADPGRLTYSAPANGINFMWDGVVSSDGSVLWIKRSIAKQPFRVRMETNDLFIEEVVKLKGDEVVPTRYVERYAAMDAGSATESIASSAPADMFGPLSEYVGKTLWKDTDKVLVGQFLLLEWEKPGRVMRVGVRAPGGDGRFVLAWRLVADESSRRINAYPSFSDLKSDRVSGVAAADGSLSLNPGFMASTSAQVIRKSEEGDLLWTNVRNDSPPYLARYRVVSSSEGESLFHQASAVYFLRQQEARKVEEEARRIESERKREEWHAYESRMSGIYSALQVTGAVIDEHAAQTQADLAATIAQGQAQGLAQRQQQQAEAAAQAAAEQRQNEDAESARLDAQNRANLEAMKQSLRQARANGLDPALIANLQQAVDGVEESLRDDAGGSGSDNSALAEQQRQQAEAERQAAARAERERLVAAKQREAERAQREEDRRRQEELAEQKQQQALRNQLAAERRGIQLRALKCPGIGNQITGLRPRVTPRIADCVTVQFEARCPGTQPGQGVSGSFYNFIGSTGNISCANDTIELPAGLSCPAEQVHVDVREVTACN